MGTIQVKPGCGADRSGGLQVDLKAPADGRWPDFHIYHHPRLGLRKGRRYRVSLWARAEPARNLTIAFYRPGQPFVLLGGPPGPFEQQIKLAADVGVDFVSFPVSLPWPQPGQPVDWSGVDAQCQRVLDANPNALLLPRIGMAPPAWWREVHPDDAMVWDMGPQKHVGFVVASPEYRRDAGKMWLYEDDTRTYLGTGKFPGWQDGVDTIEETNVQLLRNTAQCALRNFGTWWMDLGATGWFNDPRMWAEMARLKALDEPLLEEPLPFQPEIAAIIDEESMIRLAAGGDVLTRPGVYEVRRPLGRLGAPYGQYLLDDVLEGRVRAKMVVFLTAWSLTADQRERLLAATRGSLRIWCYAPGYYDGDRASLEAMSELTGFEMKKLADVSARAEPTSAGRALGLREAFGIKTPIEPLFAAADASAQETLASYPDGSAAVALRRTEDGLSLFVGPAGLTSELLRAAARKAGVHLFTETDCNVYAKGPYLALHASQDGPVEVDTGQSGAVVDLLTGEQLGPGPYVTLPLKRGDTRVLRVVNRE